MAADPSTGWLVRLDESGLLDRVDAAVIATTLDGVVLYANRYCAVLYGRSPAELVGRQSGDYAADPVPTELISEIGAAIVAGRSWEGDFRVNRPDGSIVAVHAVNSPLLGPDGVLTGVVSLAFDVTKQRDREERLTQEADFAQFLADVATLLSSSLDYTQSFQRLAELSVPVLGDLCLIDVADGLAIKRMAAVHADPTKQRTVHELEANFAPDPFGSHPAVQVIRGGAPEVRSEMPDDFLHATTRDEAHFRIVKALDFTSYMCVPLTARGNILGALTLVSSGSGRRFGPADLALAEDLAARAALALDNARLFSERAHVAQALQASLLPPSLPEIPGVQMAARYRPAGSGNEVGGDFYDIFEVAPARWALTIGDVSGKGPEAAAVAGLARHTLRAGALRERTPSRLLQLLDQALRRDETTGERFCTVCMALLDTRPARRRLRRGARRAEMVVSCGGHPLPVLLRQDGTVDVADCQGTLLGLADDVRLTDQTVTLGRGDTVVFYTDGVTEVRDARGRMFGDDGLIDVLRSSAGQPPDVIVDRVLDASTRHRVGEPHDDVAMLVVQVAS
jgi:PAS domain S-box-containing protein